MPLMAPLPGSLTRSKQWAAVRMTRAPMAVLVQNLPSLVHKTNVAGHCRGAAGRPSITDMNIVNWLRSFDETASSGLGLTITNFWFGPKLEGHVPMAEALSIISADSKATHRASVSIANRRRIGFTGQGLEESRIAFMIRRACSGVDFVEAVRGLSASCNIWVREPWAEAPGAFIAGPFQLIKVQLGVTVAP